jgi:hypothetical protein
MVERPPLARALYYGVDVGREIPPEFYQAVAEILAYVYSLRKAAAASDSPLRGRLDAWKVPQAEDRWWPKPRANRPQRPRRSRPGRHVGPVLPRGSSAPAPPRPHRAPIGFILLMGVLLVPLPPVAMDVLIALNISLRWSSSSPRST